MFIGETLEEPDKPQKCCYKDSVGKKNIHCISMCFICVKPLSLLLDHLISALLPRLSRHLRLNRSMRLWK